MILAGAVVLGTAGCTFVSTQATLIEYDPSDGVSANVGSVQVRNALAIANEDDTTVSLLLTLVNSGNNRATVNIQYEVAGEKVTTIEAVDGNSTLSFGNSPTEEQILINNPGVPAGGLYPVYVQYGDHEGSQMLVPVLAPDTNGYEGLAPVAVAE